MKNKLLLFFSLAACILLFGFAARFSGDTVTRKDVELKIPGGFPTPLYDFKNNKISPAGFMLGRKLFYDPILSSDSSTSCQTCHQRVAAFAHIDHALSHGIGGRIGTRNVPALQNLIWQNTYMWDGGVNNLEVQPINPITNPDEMNESLVHVILKLKRNKEYVQLFKRVYKDTVINSERLLKTLAQFTGLMISANSRYDRYIAGRDTFSMQEKNGLQLFRAKCASCHREPLFTDNSYRSNGLKPDTSLNDTGRGKVSGVQTDNYKFRVPGLRNIEMTFPYMHDGRFRKLKDVLNHYSNSPSTADPDITKIGTLSDKERTDIIAFLLTLTDKEFLYDARFADPGFK
ncbi:MAG: Cytochrome-c peroxidase [Bacteroidetes bacterium]|nr:Cytochrome-c peroxidase [Bacteroidota bacterium]